MADLKKISLRISGYKSFGPDGSSFDTIRPMNVVIGRNNSGKSALIDAVEFACKRGPIPADSNHKGTKGVLSFSTPLSALEAATIFPDHERHLELGGVYGEHVSKLFNGTTISMELSDNNQIVFQSTTPDLSPVLGSSTHRVFQRFNNRIPNPFAQKTFHRLAAERNIVPEPHSSGTGIDKHGAGFSNAIANIINNRELESSIVETRLLRSLNQIMGADAEFDRITVQKHSNGNWEIMLHEKTKGEVALSYSGSGLKTILLVLAFVECFPRLAGVPLSDYIFAFEELENNLHPSLQRNLMSYLRNIAVREGCVIFLTTHSGVVIDLFSRDAEAQIVHVKHDGTSARARTVATYVDHCGILDDLDIRASDLLQSNCVVWVEGPSDRIYFNHWMELFTNGEIKEGKHYQCVFYGGRLLSNLSANESPQEQRSTMALFGH